METATEQPPTSILKQQPPLQPPALKWPPLTGGHNLLVFRASCLFSIIYMAEREGFEPPIALRLCLISSQVHSTGLCHLSAIFKHLRDDPKDSVLPLAVLMALGASDIQRRLLVVHTVMCIPLGLLCCPTSQEFPDRMHIHAGHHQSTGEGMAIAMPGIVLEGSTKYARDSVHSQPGCCD